MEQRKRAVEGRDPLVPQQSNFVVQRKRPLEQTVAVSKTALPKADVVVQRVQQSALQDRFAFLDTTPVKPKSATSMLKARSIVKSAERRSLANFRSAHTSPQKQNQQTIVGFQKTIAEVVKDYITLLFAAEFISSREVPIVLGQCSCKVLQYNCTGTPI